jgi:ATPase family associated with various cellular activities (AAA)
MAIFDIIAMALITTIPIIYTFPMIVAHLFKIQGYKITDQTECNQLISKLNIKRSVFYKNGKPYGLFYGKWYIGHIGSNESQQGSQGQTMHIIMKRATYEAATDTAATDTADNKSSAATPEKRIIDIRERRGNPWWWEYSDRKYDATKFLKREPRDYQQNIIDDILSIIRNKASRSGTFFIHGDPGTGKSLLTLLLAKQIGAYYCDTWKPTDPGDNLSKVYSTISPDDDKPLVLVLEECDKLIINVLEGNVKPHLYIPIPMMDKSDWNSMLDKVTDLGFYPNLILILTSNVSRDEIHEKDASVLRDGRIDKSYHMKMV